MHSEELEVYSSESNCAVIKPPGRNYPGCVIQGDSLAILCQMAQNITTFVRELNVEDEDFLENVQELNNALVGRLLHYQDVLSSNGIRFPYARSFTEDDLVTLLSESED
jgi:hypothetical protein